VFPSRNTKLIKLNSRNAGERSGGYRDTLQITTLLTTLGACLFDHRWRSADRAGFRFRYEGASHEATNRPRWRSAFQPANRYVFDHTPETKVSLTLWHGLRPLSAGLGLTYGPRQPPIGSDFCGMCRKVLRCRYLSCPRNRLPAQS
jgi:hypothetical protein